jgi:hypothetical protein
MAFDHQLESDRIDLAAADSIIFSIFLRIPLILLGVVLDSLLLKENGVNNNSIWSIISSINKIEQSSLNNVLDKITIFANTKNKTMGWCPSLQTIIEDDDVEGSNEQHNAYEVNKERALIVKAIITKQPVEENFFNRSIITPSILTAVLRR